MPLTVLWKDLDNRGDVERIELEDPWATDDGEAAAEEIAARCHREDPTLQMFHIQIVSPAAIVGTYRVAGETEMKFFAARETS